MEEKIHIKIKRVFELAKRGVGGEKETAQRMLIDLCKKHGIDPQSLDEEEPKKYLFKVPKKHSKLFFQVVVHVTGLTNYYERTPTQILLKCLAHEALEVKETFHFFMKKYEEDEDIFYRAFVQKNGIYRKTKVEDEDEEDRPDTRTPEEEARAWKVAQMAQGLEKHNKLKQIE